MTNARVWAIWVLAAALITSSASVASQTRGPPDGNPTSLDSTTWAGKAKFKIYELNGAKATGKALSLSTNISLSLTQTGSALTGSNMMCTNPKDPKNPFNLILDGLNGNYVLGMTGIRDSDGASLTMDAHVDSKVATMKGTTIIYDGTDAAGNRDIEEMTFAAKEGRSSEDEERVQAIAGPAHARPGDPAERAAESRSNGQQEAPGLDWRKRSITRWTMKSNPRTRAIFCSANFSQKWFDVDRGNRCWQDGRRVPCLMSFQAMTLAREPLR